MSLRALRSGEHSGVRRGDVVVCVVPDEHMPSGSPAFEGWVGRLLASTAPEVPVVLGEPGAAAAQAAPADVILLGAGCEVGDGWLEGLVRAAGGGAEIATASALSDGDVQRAALGADAAVRVAAGAQRLRPRLTAPRGPCVYVRRGAIELAGPPGTAEFARRTAELGLVHVLADDVLVCAPPAAGAPAALPAPPLDGPAARAAGIAARALGPTAVVIDARVLDGPLNGTRVHVLELIAAVARTGEVRLTALVPERLDPAVADLLRALPDTELTTLSAALARGTRADVVHRPNQIDAPADLAVLAALAGRLVITQQDLIGYHNPSYFPSPAGHEGYRALTRGALAAADHVLFFSEHVRTEALAEALVEPHRAIVVKIGTDHGIVTAPVPVRPNALPGAGDDELVLCLGTDMAHKNRVFALRLAQDLQDRHGWAGRLIFAGPSVRYGSSRPEEQALLSRSQTLAGAVIDLGEVSDGEKEWLLGHAALVLYPTTQEGFGLIPFEAAAHGAPCLWAAGTSLLELLPAQAAGIVPWDVAAAADTALALMRDGARRAANIEAVGAAGEQLRWDRTGRALAGIYRAVCDGPPAPAAAMQRAGGLMGGDFSEDAVRLVGPDGLLPRELERPLLALLARPRLARPLSLAMKAGYRATQRRAATAKRR